MREAAHADAAVPSASAAEVEARGVLDQAVSDVVAVSPPIEPSVVGLRSVEPPVVVPPVVATLVVQPTPTPQRQAESAVTPVLTTAFTVTRQAVTPSPAGPQATATTVQTGAPVTSTTVGSVSAAAASTSAELSPAQTQRPAVRLALTGFDSRWMHLLAALAMAFGVSAVRVASPTTTQSPISERTSR